MLINYGWFLIFLSYFFLVKSLPLLGNFGLESANLIILIFAPFLALWASFKSSKLEQNFLTRLINTYVWALIYILFLSGLFFINGFLSQSCSPAKGMFAFFVILIPPLVFNLSLGVLASFITYKWPKICLIILFYLSYYAWHLFAWYAEPSFRIYTHLSVVIPSDLVHGTTLEASLVEFRMATILFVLAFNCFFSIFIKSSSFKQKFALLLLNIFIYISALGLQHHSLSKLQKTSKELINDYSLVLSKNLITIKANPQFSSVEKVNDILQEALLWKSRFENRLGSLKQEEVVIWLHEDYEQKFIYTGAKNVHFALPKMRQVHISGSITPHNVLGHELAHIFLGENSQHFLKMIGPNILIPNLALTEGLAMALSKEENIEVDLDLIEQAASLYQIGIKVDLNSLFSPFNTEFLSTNPSVAYIYSGAFLEFCLNKQENPKIFLQDIIASGSLNKETLIQLQSEFEKELQKELPTYATTWAKDNFVPQSIINQDCLKKDEPNYLEKTTDLIKLKKFKEAFEILSHELSITNDESTKNMIIFEAVKCLIYQKNYISALTMLNKTNKNILTPYKKRQLIIIDSLLKDDSSKNALLFFINNDALALSFYAPKIPLTKSENIILYLFSKILTNQQNYKEALITINTVLDHKELLDDILLIESQFLQGQLYLKNNDKLNAKELFKNLLLDNFSKGLNIKYNDYLERSL